MTPERHRSVHPPCGYWLYKKVCKDVSFTKIFRSDSKDVSFTKIFRSDSAVKLSIRVHLQVKTPLFIYLSRQTLDALEANLEAKDGS